MRKRKRFKNFFVSEVTFHSKVIKSNYLKNSSKCYNCYCKALSLLVKYYDYS